MYDERSDFDHHIKEAQTCIDALKQYVDLSSSAQGATVLDIGAGQGMHVGPLAAHFQRVYCSDIIDYSSLYEGAFVKLLNEKYSRHGTPLPLSRIAFVQSNAENLMFRDAFFDTVVSLNALEHIPNTRAAVSEALRVVRPGGYVFISFDPIWTADTGGHFFHRVPEPWGHLVHSPDVYCAMMKRNGASHAETEEYRVAMNRRRLNDYIEIFADLERSGLMTIVNLQCWAGLTNEAHRTHENYEHCRQLGYSDEELLLRGMRWILRKP